MKELIVRISVGVFIFLFFCTFTARIIEENMIPEIDYAPIEKISDFEIRIPKTCIYQLSNGREGIFCVKKTERLWGEELTVEFSDILDIQTDETTVTLETPERAIVGYCSQELSEGMKVKRVEK